MFLVLAAILQKPEGLRGPSYAFSILQLQDYRDSRLRAATPLGVFGVFCTLSPNARMETCSCGLHIRYGDFKQVCSIYGISYHALARKRGAERRAQLTKQAVGTQASGTEYSYACTHRLAHFQYRSIFLQDSGFYLLAKIITLYNKIFPEIMWCQIQFAK